MTGFDRTAPDRDTEQDEPEKVEGNVVPPGDLTDAEVPAENGADRSSDEDRDR